MHHRVRRSVSSKRRHGTARRFALRAWAVSDRQTRRREEVMVVEIGRLKAWHFWALAGAGTFYLAMRAAGHLLAAILGV